MNMDKEIEFVKCLKEIGLELKKNDIKISQTLVDFVESQLNKLNRNNYLEDEIKFYEKLTEQQSLLIKELTEELERKNQLSS